MREKIQISLSPLLKKFSSKTQKNIISNLKVSDCVTFWNLSFQLIIKEIHSISIRQSCGFVNNQARPIIPLLICQKQIRCWVTKFIHKQLRTLRNYKLSSRNIWRKPGIHWVIAQWIFFGVLAVIFALWVTHFYGLSFRKC